MRHVLKPFCLFISSFCALTIFSQGTRLLREPAISATQVAFAYGGDIWITSKNGGESRRITSTPATEANPHFSPDGQWLAFSSDRSGVAQVYIVSAQGGTPTRLTWYPAASFPRGWTPDDSTGDRRPLYHVACTLGI
jgi:tricorn protease